jgi:glycosyltransferase involved in cell wall biosynthesis
MQIQDIWLSRYTNLNTQKIVAICNSLNRSEHMEMFPKKPDPTCVILSIYNGQKYLREQLTSIAKQTKKCDLLLVRNDGSTDNSAESVIEICTELDLPLQLISGPNIGAANSFLELISVSAKSDCSLFAFCDQDDVWLKTKLERAISKIPDSLEPVLYCGRQYFTDAELNILATSKIPRKIGFGNSLIENIAVGCTVVLNRPAIELIAKRIPKICVMHDWWTYLLISSHGKVVFDESPQIYYRQHDSNTIGASIGVISSLKRRVKSQIRRRQRTITHTMQIQSLLDTHGITMRTNDYTLAKVFVTSKKSWLKRFEIILSRRLWRQNLIDDIAWRILILLGKY